jgi:hypothetical protein
MEGVRGAGGSTAKWRCGRTLLAMQVSHGCDFLHLYPAQMGRLRLDRNSRSKAATTPVYPVLISLRLPLDIAGLPEVSLV